MQRRIFLVSQPMKTESVVIADKMNDFMSENFPHRLENYLNWKLQKSSYLFMEHKLFCVYYQCSWRKLRIRSHLLKKSLTENFIFVQCFSLRLCSWRLIVSFNCSICISRSLRWRILFGLWHCLLQRHHSHKRTKSIIMEMVLSTDSMWFKMLLLSSEET